MIPLSVLTYNVWGLKVGRLHIAKNIDRRIRAMVSHIRALNADVIALQEVWCDTIASYLCHHLDFPYFYYEPNRHVWKGRIGNGLMILSKHPILEQHTMSFSDHTRADEYFASKGAQMIQIETSAGKMNIVNTHMGSGKKIKHIERRMLQLSELQQFIRNFPLKQPIVLAGDFNFNPDSIEYYQMQLWIRRYFDDGSGDTYAMTNREKNGHTFFLNRSYERRPTVHDQDERIDYLMTLCSKQNRSDLEIASARIVLDNPNEPLSDHCGVLVNLKLRRKSTLEEVLQQPIPDSFYYEHQV